MFCTICPQNCPPLTIRGGGGGIIEEKFTRWTVPAVWRAYFKKVMQLHYIKEMMMKRTLSLLAMLTVLIGSALFVTSCGSKLTPDTVWKVTKFGGGIQPPGTTYMCFLGDGKLIVATESNRKLFKNPLLSGDYTAKNGKMKASLTGLGEVDYKIKGDVMTISTGNTLLYELQKVAKPTADEMKKAQSSLLP